MRIYERNYCSAHGHELSGCVHANAYNLILIFALYNYIKNEKTFKNEQRNRDDAAKKRANTSGVGESNNYYEDIYNIPPYNNTH